MEMYALEDPDAQLAALEGWARNLAVPLSERLAAALQVIDGLSRREPPYCPHDCDGCHGDIRAAGWSAASSDDAAAPGATSGPGGDGRAISYRTGTKVGRTLYRHGELIGLLDTPELATECASALNAVAELIVLSRSADLSKRMIAPVEIIDTLDQGRGHV